jgi:hypothetical protein
MGDNRIFRKRRQRPEAVWWGVNRRIQVETPSNEPSFADASICGLRGVVALGEIFGSQPPRLVL